MVKKFFCLILSVLLFAAPALAVERVTMEEYLFDADAMLTLAELEVTTYTSTDQIFLYEIQNGVSVMVSAGNDGSISSVFIQAAPASGVLSVEFLDVVWINLIALDWSMSEQQADELMITLGLLDGAPLPTSPNSTTLNGAHYQVLPTSEGLVFAGLYDSSSSPDGGARSGEGILQALATPRLAM